MFEKIRKQKHMIEHIFEEYKSSGESVDYLHDLFKAFLDHFSSEIDIRKQEYTILYTEEGKKLRKFILEVHETARNKILNLFEFYQELNQAIWHPTTKLSECINKLEIKLKDVENEDQLYHDKFRCINAEISRLENIEAQILKNEYQIMLGDRFGYSASQDFLNDQLKPELYHHETIMNNLCQAREQKQKIRSQICHNQEKDIETGRALLGEIENLELEELGLTGLYEKFQNLLLNRKRMSFVNDEDEEMSDSFKFSSTKKRMSSFSFRKSRNIKELPLHTNQNGNVVGQNQIINHSSFQMNNNEELLIDGEE